MPNERQWLRAEQSGEDELAETMFASLVAQIPPIEPSADFVDRTVQAAWRARTRRRLVTRIAVTVAAIFIAIAGAGSIYELTPLATSLAARGAILFSQGLVWLLTSASGAARWWWIAERVGTAVGGAIAAPFAAAAVAALEMIALLAIYAFRRLGPHED